MRRLLLMMALLLPATVSAGSPVLPVSPVSPVLQAAQLEQGDLLFVSAGSTGLSGAIDQATRRQGVLSYDHVALVAVDGDARQVLHADAEGSRQQLLTAFMAEAHAKHRSVVVYRLKPAQQPAIIDAVATARTLLGKPYNTTYVQSEDSYYCSDFIERAFRAHHVFQTQPMNFRDKSSGAFPDHWVAFYAARGMAVPQGEPGTNPNDMAASPVLERLGILN